jgi:hypothetical protein
MSEPTDRRDARSAQVVDEPAEQVDGSAQGQGAEQVIDSDLDGLTDAAESAAGTEDVDNRTADADAVTDEAPGAVAEETTDVSDASAVAADEREELMPGDMLAAPVGALWSSQTTGGLRDRWQQLQLRFVDDPRGVVTEAQSLVSEAVQDLTQTLTEQQRDLDGWATGGDGDTEQLRVALQRYRDFFDRLLGQA